MLNVATQLGPSHVSAMRDTVEMDWLVQVSDFVFYKKPIYLLPSFSDIAHLTSSSMWSLVLNHNYGSDIRTYCGYISLLWIPIECIPWSTLLQYLKALLKSYISFTIQSYLKWMKTDYLKCVTNCEPFCSGVYNPLRTPEYRRSNGGARKICKQARNASSSA